MSQEVTKSEPKSKPKATVDNLAFELCEIKVEARMRDLQTIRAGNSLIISGFVVMFVGLLALPIQDPTPFFIGVALLCVGLSKQRQGTMDYNRQSGG
jgi:hypothetical protein